MDDSNYKARGMSE